MSALLLRVSTPHGVRLVRASTPAAPFAVLSARPMPSDADGGWMVQSLADLVAELSAKGAL